MPEDIGPNGPALDESGITSLFPGEVVTRAFVRDVELPYGAGTMALITLDNGYDHTRPTTFGSAGLISLRDALDSVADRDDIAAVGVTGKPFIFAAGAQGALKVIVENPLSQNRMLTGAQAQALGIADAMFEPADFLAESLRWAARVLTGSAEVSRTLPDEDWEQAVEAARFFADGKLHGAAPAPYRAIELVAVARDRTRDEGFAAGDEALPTCSSATS